MSQVDVQIRWLIRRDMPEVLAIERLCFAESAWTDEDFLCCLRQRNCIGMVCEHNHDILGFMVYELSKASLHILDIAVHPNHQRCGIGRQMIERLKDKLTQQRRTTLYVEVRERNVHAQRFFKSEGFRAVKQIRDFYDDTDEDCYLMRLSIEPETLSPFHPTNRISEFIND